MHDMIFVNLPVADLKSSRDFFTSLGYHFDDRFCDGNAAALVLGDAIVAMLMQEEFYSDFTDKTIVDAKTASEVLINLSARSREEVDTIVDKAIALGAKDGRTDDHGFMYGRDFEDLDGHAWGIMWMDPAAAEVGPEEFVKQQQGV